MIESRTRLLAEELAHLEPGSVRGIASRNRRWQPRCKSQIGDRYHSLPRISMGFAVAGELLQVDPRRVKTGFLAKFPARCLFQVLLSLNKASRQRPPALERLCTTPHRESA